MKKIKVEEVDWMSGLPDSILHHIFSFLPFKQVVQTCVLSKRWEELWLSYPVLEFDRSLFDGGLRDPWRSNNYNMETNKEYKWRAKKLFSVLVRILRERHKGKETMFPLKKFTLEMDFFDDFELKSLLDRCISYAIECKVKELKLIFNCSSTDLWYNPCEVIFSAKLIEVLELKGWKLELPTISKATLSSLRKLILIGVYVGDYMMKNLIDGCPLIETLCFSACSGFRSVDASGLSKLNEVKLTNNKQLGKVVIEESNVHILSIGGPARPHDISSGFCRDLISLSLSDIPITDGWISSAISENLKSLSLSDVFITNEWLCDQIFKLRFLEYLSLDKCFICSYILEISSRCLKTLMILGCLELHELVIDTPNLHIFKYRGGMVSVTLNVLDLSKISLHLCGPRFETRWYQDIVFEHQTQWYIKYIEFLAKLNDFSDLLHLQIDLGENALVPPELRQILLSPLSSVKHLNLRLDTLPMCWTITKLADGLLWLAPHTRIVSIQYGVFDVSTFKLSFSYKQLEETASCCESFPISCWQHCIEEVKLEITDEYYQGKTNSKSYILKGVDVRKQIDALCGIAAS